MRKKNVVSKFFLKLVYIGVNYIKWVIGSY